MRTRKFIVCALASLAFAGCSQDDLNTTDDNGVVKDPTGEAYVSISIKTPATTRALNTPDQETGTSAESKVEKLKLVFFDNSTPKVVTDVKDYTVGTDLETGAPNQPNGTAGKAFKIAATSKHILVVANPIAAFAPTVGQSYDVVNDALTATATDVATADKFMMSNAKGDLEPSAANGDDIDLTLYSSATAAESHPCQINIDRVAAKVRVYTAGVTSTFANITDAGWVLNVTNKKFFPCSKRVHTAVNSVTPFDQYSLGSYREDPNYSTQFDPTTQAADYAGEYNFYSSVSAPAWIAPCDATVAGEPQYCLENTQTAAFNMHAYTTQVLFKAVVSPTGLKDVTGVAYDITGGADWIAIGASYFSYDELVKYIEKELTNKYSSADPALYSASLFNSLYAYLNDVLAGAQTTLALDETVHAPLAGATLTSKVASYINPLTADKAAVEAAGNKAKTVGHLSYYAGGVSYYKIMIKHDDDATVLNALGEFGVVRNSVYDLNITKVNNPGYPSIPNPDPETPDEDEDTWLSVQINVNPWTWYTQEVHL